MSDFDYDAGTARSTRERIDRAENDKLRAELAERDKEIERLEKNFKKLMDADCPNCMRKQNELVSVVDERDALQAWIDGAETGWSGYYYNDPKEGKRLVGVKHQVLNTKWESGDEYVPVRILRESENDEEQ